MTSSRGSHKRSQQMRMDLESVINIPEVKDERLKNDVLTLFDEDFPPSVKAIRDWMFESYTSLYSYWQRNSKKEEILRKNMNFYDGMKYVITCLISELTVDQGKSLEESIMEDLGPLVSEYCTDCKAKIEL